MKKKFIFISFCLIFLSSLSVGLISNFLIRKMHKEDISNSLKNTGKIATKFLENESLDKNNLFNLVKNIKGHTNQRITVYNETGIPIADSHNNSIILKEKSILDNYNKFFDKNLKYVLERHYHSDQICIKIFTEKISSNKEEYFVSVSQPLEDFDIFQRNIFLIIISSVLISSFFVTILSLIVNKKELDKLDSKITSMEQEIIEKAKNLESILMNVSEGIILMNSSTKIIEINDFAKKILNYDSKINQLSQYNFFEIISKIVELTFKEQKPLQIDTKYFENEIRISTYPIKNISNQIIIILTDISSIKDFEERKKAFVSNASHELKTPLTIISGFLETISLKRFKNETQLFYFIDIIEKEVNRLKKLVYDLLSLATLENTYMQINRIEELSTKKIILNLQKIFSELILEKNLKVTWNYEDKEIFINFKKEWLEIIIQNIFENSIKYTPEYGAIDVKIYIENFKMIVVISDTGIGIAKENQNKIFERFYREDLSHSKAIEGTGLGLSIVKHMLDLVQGEIYLESEINIGSKFIVEIPISSIKNI